MEWAPAKLDEASLHETKEVKPGESIQYLGECEHGDCEQDHEPITELCECGEWGVVAMARSSTELTQIMIVSHTNYSDVWPCQGFHDKGLIG